MSSPSQRSKICLTFLIFFDFLVAMIGAAISLVKLIIMLISTSFHYERSIFLLTIAVLAVVLLSASLEIYLFCVIRRALRSNNKNDFHKWFGIRAFVLVVYVVCIFVGYLHYDNNYDREQFVLNNGISIGLMYIYRLIELGLAMYIMTNLKPVQNVQSETEIKI